MFLRNVLVQLECFYSKFVPRESDWNLADIHQGQGLHPTASMRTHASTRCQPVPFYNNTVSQTVWKIPSSDFVKKTQTSWFEKMRSRMPWHCVWYYATVSGGPTSDRSTADLGQITQAHSTGTYATVSTTRQLY